MRLSVVRGFAPTMLLGFMAVGLITFGAARASAATCLSWGAPPPDVGEGSHLNGVAATSACDTWAVGYYYDGIAQQTLIEHWNGTAWKVQPSPNPDGSSNPNGLAGVAATSSTNAWAVGNYNNGTADQTLALHYS